MVSAPVENSDWRRHSPNEKRSKHNSAAFVNVSKVEANNRSFV